MRSVCVCVCVCVCLRGASGEEPGGHFPADCEALPAETSHQPGESATHTRRHNTGSTAAEG